jgi:hypothetical protein
MLQAAHSCPLCGGPADVEREETALRVRCEDCGGSFRVRFGAIGWWQDHVAQTERRASVLARAREQITRRRGFRETPQITIYDVWGWAPPEEAASEGVKTDADVEQA